MLSGLCNVCDDFGHSNFDNLCELVNEISKVDGREGTIVDCAFTVKHLRQYPTFLKRKFSKLVERHTSCLELCMDYAFGSCSQEHLYSLKEATEFYTVCEKLFALLHD